MGPQSGGRIALDILRQQREELENYFGSINELKQGLIKEIPEKPATLYWYEMVKSTGLPLVSGGLLDQPHFWLLQWSLVESVLGMFEAVEAQSEKMNLRN